MEDEPKNLGPFGPVVVNPFFDEVHAELVAMVTRIRAMDNALEAALEAQLIIDNDQLKRDSSPLESELDCQVFDHELDKLQKHYDKYVLPGSKQQFHYAFFMAVWSYYEQVSFKLARDVGLSLGAESFELSAKNVGRVKDHVVGNLRDYVKNVAKLDVPGEEWSDMFVFNLARNCIAHKGGDVTTLDEHNEIKLRRFMAERWMQYASVDGDRLAFGAEFCFVLCDCIFNLVQVVTNLSLIARGVPMRYSYPRPSHFYLRSK